MINFDSLTLQALLQENFDFFKGARIQKIQQPTRQEFIFGLRNQGESRKLYVNIHPNFCHVCFMSRINENKRYIEIPKQPPMFCMLLRKYLESARIAKINQPQHERILEFYFETQNELSETIYLCLSIELMGKHSNVVLYNYDTNVIIGCAHNIGAEKSREREMAGTLPYVYPPRQNKKDILSISFEEFFQEVKTSSGDLYKSLSEKFYDLSQPFARQICEHSGIFTGKAYVKSNLEKLFSNLPKYLSFKNISPVISPDWSEFSLYTELLKDGIVQGDVNSMIDNYFSHHQEFEKIKSLKSQLSTLVNSKLRKVNNSTNKIQKQLKSAENIDLYRKKGDLIMSNLYASKDFSSSIDVFDYENNANLKIDLDEAKTLKDNANIYYKFYNKAKITANKSQEMIENLQKEKEYLDQIIYSISCAESVNDCLEIQDEVHTLDNHTIKAIAKSKAFGIEEHKLGNFAVFVGKNNKQNDYIISKLAKDEDFWFHVHNNAGAHVLLKLENGTEPDEKTIFECAKLAKENSNAKDSSKVGVIYTKRKFLKKPPGANLGYVTYKDEKEIIID